MNRIRPLLQATSSQNRGIIIRRTVCELSRVAGRTTTISRSFASAMPRPHLVMAAAAANQNYPLSMLRHPWRSNSSVRGYHSKNAESNNNNNNRNSNNTNNRNNNNSQTSPSSPAPQPLEELWIASHLHQHHPHVLGSLTICHPATPYLLGFSIGGDWEQALPLAEPEEEQEQPPPHTLAASASLLKEPTYELPPHSSVQQEQEEQKQPVQQDPPRTTKRVWTMPRNTRPAKKANHGKRPCNRNARRAKRRRYGNPKRQ